MDLLNLGELQVSHPYPSLQQPVSFPLIHLLQKIRGGYKNKETYHYKWWVIDCSVLFPGLDVGDQLIGRNTLKWCRSFQSNCWPQGAVCVRRPPTSLCKYYPVRTVCSHLYSHLRHWKQTGLVSKFITSSIPYLRGKTAARQVLFWSSSKMTARCCSLWGGLWGPSKQKITLAPKSPRVFSLGGVRTWVWCNSPNHIYSTGFMLG